MRRFWLIGVVLISSVLLFGCGAEEERLQVAKQYGLPYAPLEIMEAKGFDEDLGVEWVQVNNSAALREGMLTGSIDVGFMGIPPFLIGVDKEMDWAMFTGLNRSYLALNGTPEIGGLEEIAVSDRIALPQPGSIQHILLGMAAERRFGAADRFDDQLVALNHPEGMLALAEDPSVRLHFTTLPYVLEERSEGAAIEVLSGEEAFGGPFTLIVGVTSGAFARDEADRLAAFEEALERSIAFMADHPEESLAILSESYGLPVTTLERWMEEGLTTYGTTVEGYETFVVHMLETGMITGDLEKYEGARLDD
jgi:NitT/TauT family transport system substrate-binding protein